MPRDKPAGLRLRFNDEAEGLAISTIVLMELLHGAAKSARPINNRRAVEDFASRLDVLPFDEQAAAHACDIKAELETAGEVIGSYDLLIAGLKDFAIGRWPAPSIHPLGAGER